MRMDDDRISRSGPYTIIEGAVKIRDGKRVSLNHFVYCLTYVMPGLNWLIN